MFVTVNIIFSKFEDRFEEHRKCLDDVEHRFMMHLEGVGKWYDIDDQIDRDVICHMYDMFEY